MDKENNYKLQLNNFETIVSKNWRSLQREDEFHDVTIVCENTEIKAHKVILSSNSSVFKNILSRSRHPHPVIYFRGIRDKDMSHILDFIYQGEIDVDQTDIDELLSVAKDLKIRGLFEIDREKATSLTWSRPWSKVISEANIQSKNVVDNDEFVITENTNISECQNELLSSEGDLEFEESAQDIVEKLSSVPHLQFQTFTEFNYPNSFQNKSSVEEIVTYHRIKEREYKKLESYYKNLESCDKCDYKPKNQNKHHLKEHIQMIHEGIRYPCDLCEYQAKSKRKLKDHKEFKHEGVHYPCDMCNYQSPTQSRLKDHYKKKHHIFIDNFDFVKQQKQG